MTPSGGYEPIALADGAVTGGNVTMAAAASPPFRFYDNRQKYLAFVTTCNEKSAVARRAAMELIHLRPKPPAVRLFDAGMGDATVLAQLMRTLHHDFRTVPMMVVAKEISLEDVRLGLEKMPDRHTLPSEIGDRIGTSTLFAAWNAAIYVNQIEDERLEPVVTSGRYLDETQQVLQTHGGLWFNDEAFVLVRRRD